jgi:Ca-activated chloride channel family protein
MTNDFKYLTDALRATPSPDPSAKAEAIALAMKNFDALQGSPAAPRPTSEPTRKGFLNGARNMLKSLTSRPILGATTSVAALGLGLVLVLPLSQKPLGYAPKPQPESQIEAVAATAPETMADALAAPAPAPGTSAKQGMAQPLTESRAQSPAFAASQEITNMDQGLEYTTTSAPNTEAFANETPNPVKVTAEAPVSTFSIDVDTASYAVIRSSLKAGQLPDPAAVRIEEMVNYFPYTYAAPETEPFRATIGTMPTPWNPGTKLVHIALQGRLPAVADRPALNLVFLIDTSGSMNEPDKLPLLKLSLRLLLGQLRPQDQIAIVAYAGSAGEVLAPTAASDSANILTALNNLAAGGSTAGAEGLALAYQVAKSMTTDGEVSRILLATDGDFNVGIADPDGLEAYVAKQRDTAYLSVLGFGRGNLDDATMQALAQNGNGTAAYIDTLAEAQKTLVDQMTGALFPIADDVKIQVEWNPAQVAEYRLIGYETRTLAREDFNNDRVDAGEIGAGHQVTAIYEITPPGSPALRNDPLRYATPAPTADSPELGYLRLRYKEPGSDISILTETPITETAVAFDVGFAAAIAGFGQLLQGSIYLDDWGWDQAIALATIHRGPDPFGYRAEAVTLMRLAQSLSTQ